MLVVLDRTSYSETSLIFNLSFRSMTDAITIERVRSNDGIAATFMAKLLEACLKLMLHEA